MKKGLQVDTYALVDSKSGENLKAPVEYRAYAVQDPLDQKIGRMETLFVNGVGEPQYVRVKTGRLQPRFVLLPVGKIVLDEARRTLVLGSMNHA